MLLSFLFSPLHPRPLAAEVPRDFTPDRTENIHGKGRLQFITGEKYPDTKSRFLPREHQNCDLNFWGCKTQSFCSSPGWMPPLHFKLALVSLCLLSELIFRADNSALSAEALNTETASAPAQSQRHCWNTLLFYTDAWMSHTGSDEIILEVEWNYSWWGGD